MKATWNGQLLAESDQTIVVEGNHYFPKSSIDCAYFRDSDKTSYCGWKGTANYFHLNVDGETNTDAAWHYPEPLSGANEIRDHIAFWKGVNISA
ncbi:Uncharacterised protein [BD1-7 clade bacterium]|uniref:DUF427 domain-containing protein n=1 Tax=BD1-7 clade bacterium TaxID=2029982 RepID=A0A5S9PMN4_9GAMM|nr:Uncharacterised protein [BD1-7 clade bacterium]CAA0110582.1 Uncharacterised protein [BD1-7 clade bacterium]